MNKNIFGTDGVRGIANTEISVGLAQLLGKAFAVFIMQNQQSQEYSICIGRDTRPSGDMIHSAFISGVMSMGVNVIDVGICPTPCISYLTRKLSTSGGVVITASHNLSDFNGIKLMDNNGVKLDTQAELSVSEIFHNITDYLCDTSVGKLVVDADLPKLWADYLVECVDKVNLDNLNIVVDCANGAGFRVVPYVLRSLGASVTCINCANDGANINLNCGSTCVTPLVEAIQSGNFDLGFAFDGDADRLAVVDSSGLVLSGDQILYIIANYLSQQNQLPHNTIVSTIVSNHGLDQSLTSSGINVIRTSVGDKFVLSQLLAGGYALGGENSGHIILPKYNLSADALLTSLFLLKIIVSSGKTLPQLLDGYTPYPTVSINVPVSPRQHALVVNGALDSSIHSLLTELGDSGTLLVRASGTQPIVRILVEGDNSDLITKIANTLQSLTLSL